jgi:Mrp family chromosome partitioning ATPase
MRRHGLAGGVVASGWAHLALDTLRVPGPQAKSVLVTSAHTGEGKSTVTLALARAAASEGYKAVILDCDVRTPGLRRIFMPKSALAKAGDHPDKLQILEDPLSGCKIYLWEALSAGSAASVFRSPEFRALVHDLSQRFDLVLVDGPSGENLTEVMLLCRVVDVAVFLAMFEKTPISDVQSAVRDLARLGRCRVVTGLNALRGSGHERI